MMMSPWAMARGDPQPVKEQVAVKEIGGRLLRLPVGLRRMLWPPMTGAFGSGAASASAAAADTAWKSGGATWWKKPEQTQKQSWWSGKFDQGRWK